ncbi:hypothetical protein ASE95_14495 [Sphingomonas sp. Leaf231]|nr:hypothetical protein ASE95_14495 [Sphingomonas sp. Leaf231]
MLFGEQMVLEDCERGYFERPLAYRKSVCAGAALLLSGAAVIVLAGDGIACAAAAAADKPGEQMLLAILAGYRHLCVGTAASFDLLTDAIP